MDDREYGMVTQTMEEALLQLGVFLRLAVKHGIRVNTAEVRIAYHHDSTPIGWGWLATIPGDSEVRYFNVRCATVFDNDMGFRAWMS